MNTALDQMIEKTYHCHLQFICFSLTRASVSHPFQLWQCEGGARYEEAESTGDHLSLCFYCCCLRGNPWFFTLMEEKKISLFFTIAAGSNEDSGECIIMDVQYLHP